MEKKPTLPGGGRGPRGGGQFHHHAERRRRHAGRPRRVRERGPDELHFAWGADHRDHHREGQAAPAARIAVSCAARAPGARRKAGSPSAPGNGGTLSPAKSSSLTTARLPWSEAQHRGEGSQVIGAGRPPGRAGEGDLGAQQADARRAVLQPEPGLRRGRHVAQHRDELAVSGVRTAVGESARLPFGNRDFYRRWHRPARHRPASPRSPGRARPAARPWWRRGPRAGRLAW